MRFAPRWVAVLAGLLVAHAATSSNQKLPYSPLQGDFRLLKLKSFFKRLDSPSYFLSEEYLLAADRYGLDWRLLPSISVVESGGGKAFRNNNILGWDACRREFPSVADGIHYVARSLATSELYKGKSLDMMLATYNPHPGYPSRVKSLMTQMSLRSRRWNAPAAQLLQHSDAEEKPGEYHNR